MQTFTFTITYLLAALFAIGAAAAAVEARTPAPVQIQAREANLTCAQYSSIANLSAIAQNSTFRGAFIQASPDGTLSSENLLTNALKEWTSLALINDTALNAQCGNLTAIALNASVTNFTQGIVGGFHIGAAARLGGHAGYTAAGAAVMVAVAMLTL